MAEPAASNFIPNTIHAYWLADEDFLSEYALLDYWTPFETACLINSAKPGEIVDGVARIGLLPTEIHQYDENPQDWVEPDALIRLTQTILKNNGGQANVPSRAIVSWAVDNRLLQPRSYLARILLPDQNDVLPGPTDDHELRQRIDEALKQIDQLNAELEQARKSSKETGKEHAQNHSRILAAALCEMALQWGNDKLFLSGKINAAELARNIDACRDGHNLPPPEKHGFSYENIASIIRAALPKKHD